MAQLLQSAPFGRWTPRRRRILRWCLLLSLYLIAALWSIWPAPQWPFDVLPTAGSTAAAIPMLNAWTIWWNADRLAHGLQDYWDAPIFHPAEGAFAFSEPQPASWLVAPVVWLSGSPVPAYHAYLICLLVLNGLFAARLLRLLGTGWLATAIGGLAMVLHPLVHRYGDVIQLMSLWGVLWTIAALVKLHQRPSPLRGIELGVALAAVFMSTIHHGLFLALLLGLTAWITIPQWQWKRWCGAVAIAAAILLLLLLPLLWPMRQILERYQFSRRPAMVQSLSATPADWLQVPAGALVQLPQAEQTALRALNPGWIRTMLALAGVAFCLRHRRQRRAVLFMTALACCALVWSFGLNLQIVHWQPWVTLAEWIPPFAQVRSAFRFAYFVQLVVILLASMALGELWRWWRSENLRRHTRWLSGAGLAALALVVALEVPPAQVHLVGVPNVAQERAWTSYLREQGRVDSAVVCLPFGAGLVAQDFDQTSRWMLYATQHERRLVNGYSGFFPETWFRFAQALTREPFAQKTLEMLDQAEVEFIVVQTNLMPADLSPPARSGRFRLVKVFDDPAGIEIWRLEQVVP